MKQQGYGVGKYTWQPDCNGETRTFTMNVCATITGADGNPIDLVAVNDVDKLLEFYGIYVATRTTYRV